jgi:hypothetical protein
MNALLRRVVGVVTILVTLLGRLASAETVSESAFDIPQLDAVVIDGAADDWADRGLKVDVFRDGTAAPRNAGFDASARVAWDASGLLVLVRVIDATPEEAAQASSGWAGDGVEFFFAERGQSRSFVHLMVTPGTDGVHPELRWACIDHRSPEQKARGDVTAEFARTKIEGGYVIEGRLPWSNFGGAKKLGDVAGLQLYVSDLYRPKRHRAIWLDSEQSHEDATATNLLTLAKEPSPPIRAVVAMSFERWRRSVVRIRVAEQLVGSELAVSCDRTGAPATTTQKIIATAPDMTIELGPPPVDADSMTTRVRVDEKLAAQTVRSGLVNERLVALRGIQLRTQYVFGGAGLPAVEPCGGSGRPVHDRDELL